MSERYHLAANTVIRASAGTGKTYALVETVIHLLAGLTHHNRALSPREIVAITFTEKAAAEMLSRIRERVSALARGDADSGLAKSAEILGVERPDQAHWLGVQREVDQLRVSTFHSFCLALLQRYPLEAGLDPSFGFFDEDAASARLNDIVELEVLASLQNKARTDELAELIELVGLTQWFEFSSRGLFESAPELLHRIHESGLSFSSVRSLLPLDGLERTYAEPLLDLLERIDARFQAEKLRLGLVDFSDMQRYAANLLKSQETVRTAVKKSISVLLIDEFQDTNPIQRDLTLLLAEERGKCAVWSAEAMAPPSDLLLEPRGLFVVGDAKQSIYNFRGADVAIFRELEAMIMAQGGQGFALQTSYRSRPSLVMAANEYFRGLLDPDLSHPEPWFINWSEDAELVPAREERVLYPPVHWLDSSDLCVERCESASRASDRRLSQSEEFSAIADFIVDIVQGERPWPVVDETEAESEQLRDAAFRDITILLRKFRGSLTELTYQLDQRKIPYYVVKGGGFFGSQEVLDVACALKAVSSSCDPLSLTAWLRGPLISLSDEGLARLARDNRQITSSAVAKAAQDESSSWLPADRAALLVAAQTMAALDISGEVIGPLEAVRQLCERTDYRAFLAGLPDGDQGLANLDQIEDLARRYGKRTGASLAGFAQQLMRLVDSDPKTEAFQIIGERDDVVRIMTIHQSKGLDCRIAVIPEAPSRIRKSINKLVFGASHGLGVKLDEGALCEKYPLISKEEHLRELAQARRLMYVAFTRARDYVVLSGSVPIGKNRRRTGPRYEVKRPDRATPSWLRVMNLLKTTEPRWLKSTPVQLYLDSAPRLVTELPSSEAAASPLALLSNVQGHSDRLVGSLTTAVTQLSDFADCPRKYWYLWEMGVLPEFLGVPGIETSREASGEDGGRPATEFGTLLHFMLEHVQIARFKNTAASDHARYLRQLAALAQHDLNTSEVETLVNTAVRTLNGPVGEILATSPSVEREVDFLLHIPNPSTGCSLYLRGQVDLLLRDEAGRTQIIDYKYSWPSEDLDKYRFQLLSYALAVHRSNGSPKGVDYRAAIAFLRSEEPVIRALEPEVSTHVLDDFSMRLSAIAGQIVESRQTRRWPLAGSGRSDPLCHGCGFSRLCFAAPSHDKIESQTPGSTV